MKQMTKNYAKAWAPTAGAGLLLPTTIFTTVMVGIMTAGGPLLWLFVPLCVCSAIFLGFRINNSYQEHVLVSMKHSEDPDEMDKNRRKKLKKTRKALLSTLASNGNNSVGREAYRQIILVEKELTEMKGKEYESPEYMPTPPRTRW